MSHSRVFLLSVSISLHGVLATFSSFAATDSRPEPWSSGRPDGHAPIGVMGDHVHHNGEWMLSYRFMTMKMAGNRSGTDRASEADVLAQFPVAPRTMTMSMHMLGAMRAVSDNVTLMAMVPMVDKEMDHITRMGQVFTTSTSGLGDISLSGLIRLTSTDRTSLHVGLGVSLPTGEIDRRGTTPMGPGQKLPYPMQLGSGSWEVHPSITWLGQRDTWSWGAQAKTKVRIDTNAEGYKLGDELLATGWVARRLSNSLSLSVRLTGLSWGDISGRDEELNPMMVPTARADLRGGERFDLAVGVNLFAPSGRWAGHRVALEISRPVFQDLDGPQLETDWVGTAGWQWAF